MLRVVTRTVLGATHAHTCSLPTCNDVLYTLLSPSELGNLYPWVGFKLVHVHVCVRVAEMCVRVSELLSTVPRGE